MKVLEKRCERWSRNWKKRSSLRDTRAAERLLSPHMLWSLAVASDAHDRIRDYLHLLEARLAHPTACHLHAEAQCPAQWALSITYFLCS